MVRTGKSTSNSRCPCSSHRNRAWSPLDLDEVARQDLSLTNLVDILVHNVNNEQQLFLKLDLKRFFIVKNKILTDLKSIFAVCDIFAASLRDKCIVSVTNKK